MPAPAPTASATSSPSGESRAEAAERVLFLATDLRTDGLRKVCPETLPDAARVRCLVALRYEDEPPSRALALTLLDETGSLAGLLPDETNDDGRGGKVHLAPARPVGDNREQLAWLIHAFRDYAEVLAGLAQKAPLDFRDRPVDLRFFVSRDARAPSAFAVKNNVGYNLYGLLNVSEDAVREIVFHELFHLNDDRHARWSSRAIAPIYDRIIARCGRRGACLAPYAPTDTKSDGVYYAFAQPGGAREYAAEVGVRYYREQRLMLQKKPLATRAFKCGPPENLAAWTLVSTELFGGADLVPDCAPGG
ncbi:MAG: hypothetical protein U0359_37530 [Byssovorax sp.]